MPKSSKIKRNTIVKKTFEKQVKRSNLSTAIIALVGIIFVSLAWTIYRTFIVPSDINLVATQTDFELTNAPIGCFYKQVQCVKAPCNPILVCPQAESPGSQNCTQEVGTCVGNDGSCINFTDGCQKNKLCTKDQSQSYKCSPDNPHQQPSIPSNCTTWFDGCNECKVENGKITSCTKRVCIQGGIRVAEAKCLAYSTTAPSPSVVPSPSPASAVINSFTAKSACGTANFNSYQYTCVNGKNYLEEGTCQSLESALNNARVKCGK